MPPTAAPAAAPETVRTPDAIADRIVDAILAGRIAAGQHLGEQALAGLFGVSRTVVREALARLSARGMVWVSARRGWFVVQPSLQEARDAFDARIAIETGLVQSLGAPLSAEALRTLKRHVAQERAAIRAGEPGERSYLLGEFHVCLAECAGNALLADILKDLTARTTLIAALYQSNQDASRSCADHAAIVQALQDGDLKQATRLVREHLKAVADNLHQPNEDNPAERLRAALAGIGAAGAAAPTAAPAAAPRLFSRLVDEAATPRRSTRRSPKEK
ncbi:GntR family transcriptional regulator [Aquabacterium sp. J223]|uniref:GntR family transcriptional regulator n=1 Tax=Aquabacterium sp. J223 TaxID=2898431 RepID=UPI0021ADC0F9|nr:GntR family transcriptional regulator [Aquabacterium sp. J223]UUX95148.1 GntR family transcriptional regulator [Aquabacterium sp. J223]